MVEARSSRRNEILRGHGRAQESTPRASNRKNWTTTHRYQVGRRQEGRRTSLQVGEELNNGIDQAMCAATPPSEALKLWAVKLAARERDEGIHRLRLVDFLRVYAQARPSTYVEVPDEDKTEEAVCVGAWSGRCTERRKRPQHG